MKDLLVKLVTVGEVELDLALVGEALGETYGLRWAMASGLELPPESFVPKRSQYGADVFLKQLSVLGKEEELVLGVTDVDLYIPQLSFVFGLAHAPSRTAVISLTRLKEAYYSRRHDLDAFYLRAAKEAVHEIGHVLGLRHCASPQCVMFFSSGLEDTDRKGPLPCPRCRAMLESQAPVRNW